MTSGRGVLERDVALVPRCVVPVGGQLKRHTVGLPSGHQSRHRPSALSHRVNITSSFPVPLVLWPALPAIALLKAQSSYNLDHKSHPPLLTETLTASFLEFTIVHQASSSVSSSLSAVWSWDVDPI